MAKRAWLCVVLCVFASCGAGDEHTQAAKPSASPSEAARESSRSSASKSEPESALAPKRSDASDTSAPERSSAVETGVSKTQIRYRRVDATADEVARFWPELGDRRVACYELEVARSTTLLVELLDPRLRDTNARSPRRTERIELDAGPERWAYGEIAIEAGTHRLYFCFHFEPQVEYEFVLLAPDGPHSLQRGTIPSATRPSDREVIAPGIRNFKDDEESSWTGLGQPILLDAWPWRRDVDANWLLAENPYVLAGAHAPHKRPAPSTVPALLEWREPAWLLRVAAFDADALAKARAKK